MVKPKKFLGQHFLKDENIARKIVDSLTVDVHTKNILEIGPGKGVLTKYLLQKKDINFKAVEIDKESVNFLKEAYPDINNKIVHGDFLKTNFDYFGEEELFIIGNFPYNISSPILFKIVENKRKVTGAIGMFQKEVAERLKAIPCTKAYGILAVLIGAYYEIKYLFTVSEKVFFPRPNVKSAVVKFTRKQDINLKCNEELFKKIVKAGFNQRRKTLRNALKSSIFVDSKILSLDVFNQRAEELSISEFVNLTNLIEKNQKINEV